MKNPLPKLLSRFQWHRDLRARMLWFGRVSEELHSLSISQSLTSNTQVQNGRGRTNERVVHLVGRYNDLALPLIFDRARYKLIVQSTPHNDTVIIPKRITI